MFACPTLSLQMIEFTMAKTAVTVDAMNILYSGTTGSAGYAKLS